MKKELMTMWKIKSLDMLNVPPPLFGRGNRAGRRLGTEFGEVRS
jgi:hypothetical protein